MRNKVHKNDVLMRARRDAIVCALGNDDFTKNFEETLKNTDVSIF